MVKMEKLFFPPFLDTRTSEVNLMNYLFEIVFYAFFTLLKVGDKNVFLGSVDGFQKLTKENMQMCFRLMLLWLGRTSPKKENILNFKFSTNAFFDLEWVHKKLMQSNNSADIPKMSVNISKKYA
jgi:hypothetical protein